jgi:hypothetical protein
MSVCALLLPRCVGACGCERERGGGEGRGEGGRERGREGEREGGREGESN